MKKINKLSEAAKFLIIAGTILIVCTLVVVGFFVMKEGKEGTNKSLAQFNGITSNYNDIEREKYHNLEISGSSLTELIQKEVKVAEIDIYYLTKKAGSTEVKATATLPTTRTDSNYINPNGSFKGTVSKDDNGMITRLTFVQTK